jgi:subtilase family serine protease
VNKPSWQHDKGCPGRSETDISVDADPNTGVVIAFGKKFYSAGGTSASSPMIAAMIALAGNTKIAGPAYIWNTAARNRGAFHAITSGDNEDAVAHTFMCPGFILYICQAGTHMNGTYSGPTGWGSPNGLRAL